MIASTVVALSALLFAHSAAAHCSRDYTIQEGDICDSISAAKNVSTYQLAIVNYETINEDCSNLVPGNKLCLGWIGVDCATTTVVQKDDTCEIIQNKAGINSTILYVNNPQINDECNNLYIGEVLCTEKSVVVPNAPDGHIPATTIPATATPAVSTNTPAATSSSVGAVTSSSVGVATSSLLAHPTSSVVALPTTSVIATTPAANTAAATTAAPAATSSAVQDDEDDEDCDEEDDEAPATVAPTTVAPTTVAPTTVAAPTTASPVPTSSAVQQEDDGDYYEDDEDLPYCDEL